MLKTTSLVLFGLCCFSPLLFPKETMSKEKVKTPEVEKMVPTILAILGLKEKDRYKQLIQLSNERSELELRLNHELGNAKEKSKKIAIVYLLGLYRFGNTARDLSEIIDIESVPRDEDRKAPLWLQYPAVRSLELIGKPAVPFVIKNITNAPKPLVRSLSTEVLYIIEGPAVSKFLLENEMNKTSDEKSRKKIREALQQIDKMAK